MLEGDGGRGVYGERDADEDGEPDESSAIEIAASAGSAVRRIRSLRTVQTVLQEVSQE